VRRSAVAFLALAASPAGAQATDAFAGVPNLSFRYYPVAGTDAASLRQSIDAGRPTDPHGGEPVDAGTDWAIRWRWPARRGGGCDLAQARVTFRATVTLPRLAEGTTLPPTLLDAWTRYMTALELHEAGHARYAYDHRGEVAAAIRGATCRTADRRARAALAAITAHDLAYDRDTQHGQSQGASFP
jgi:predicted secreted Zn-dependent protease